jgi:aspartate-semialdehyde dehydrogenase
MGREIRDLFPDSGIAGKLVLVAGGEEEAGVITRLKDEPAVVSRLEPDALVGIDLVFLAGTAESSRLVLSLNRPAALVDLTYAVEDAPDARIRAPLVEALGYAAPAGTVHVAAHPAAFATALLLGRLHELSDVARSVVHVFEPASERGRKGLEELQQQTVNLLSFKGLPKDIFDAQLSFNMLARYGEEAPECLEGVEQRIERHLASLHAGSHAAPLPSLRLIQAPVFHGYSLSFWVEFEDTPGMEAIEKALASDPLDMRGADLEPPTNAGIAGQSGIAIGALTPDRNNPHAAWFWAVADNIRLSAENAISIARQLL